MVTLEFIEINDFGCIHYAAIPLQKQGMALISGDNRDTDAANNNGCGKTTIGHALTWGLFEDTLDPLYRYDRVIRKDANQAEVKITFSTLEGKWVVNRSRLIGKTSLTLLGETKDGSTEFWPGSSAEIQAKINLLLGRDFRSFCNTAFFGQIDLKRFFSATDSEKKETLHRILRSDIFRACEKQLREITIREIYRKIDILAERERNLIARRNEYNTQELSESSERWEAALARQVEIELEKSNELVFRARTYDEEAARKQNKYRSQISGHEKEVKRMQPELSSIEELKHRREEISVRLQATRAELTATEGRIKKYQKELELLSGDVCPTCTAPLNSLAPANYIDTIRVDFARARVARTRLSRDLRKDELDYDTVAAAVEETQKIQFRLQEEQHEIQRLESDIAIALRDAQIAKAQLKERAIEHVDRAKQLQRETNPYEQQLAAALDNIDKLDKELESVREELNSQKDSVLYFEFWVRGFGSRGLPSMLLDSVMPFLTDKVNYYLRILTDGDIVVEFSTLRELKSKKGETRDEITVSCTIEGVEDSSPSHAQRRKLEIATDMALIDLAGTRESAGSFLFLDEVLDGLDSEGESRVLRLLRQLRERYSTIFVITHEPRLAQSFDRVFQVVKQDRAATVAEVV